MIEKKKDKLLDLNRINRNIVECKLGAGYFFAKYKKSINRNIVECKLSTAIFYPVANLY